MPQAIMRDPTPAWLKPGAESVTDSNTTKALRALAKLIGADDPASQVMGVMTSGTPAGEGGVLGMVKKAIKMDPLSRLKRASTQGYTVDAYKGGYPYDTKTGKELTELRSPERELPAGAFDNFVGRSGGHAGYFSNDPSVASRFAGPDGAVWPVKIKSFKRPLVIDAEGRFSANFQFSDMAKTANERSGFDALHEAMRGGNPKGYDGIVLRNTADEGTVYIPLASQQVRSRFAAFDPSKKKSSDLLASIAAALGVSQTANNEPGQ